MHSIALEWFSDKYKADCRSFNGCAMSQLSYDSFRFLSCWKVLYAEKKFRALKNLLVLTIKQLNSILISLFHVHHFITSISWDVQQYENDGNAGSSGCWDPQSYIYFLATWPTLAFFVPRTFFILFLRSLRCLRVTLLISTSPWRARRCLGSNFLAKSNVS